MPPWHGRAETDRAAAGHVEPRASWPEITALIAPVRLAQPSTSMGSPMRASILSFALR